MSSRLVKNHFQNMTSFGLFFSLHFFSVITGNHTPPPPKADVFQLLYTLAKAATRLSRSAHSGSGYSLAVSLQRCSESCCIIYLQDKVKGTSANGFPNIYSIRKIFCRILTSFFGYAMFTPGFLTRISHLLSCQSFVVSICFYIIIHYSEESSKAR